MSKTWDIEVTDNAGNLLLKDTTYTEGRVRNPVMASSYWISVNRTFYQEKGLTRHNVKATARPSVQKPESKSPDMTCGACLRTQKATKGLMAHHGYKRPGGGWQTASCIGARMLPWEVSPEAGVAVQGVIRRFVQAQVEHLASLQDPARTEFKIVRPTMRGSFDRTAPRFTESILVKGEPRKHYPALYSFTCFEEQIEIAVNETTRHKESAERDLREVEKRLAEWKPKAQVAG